MFSQQSDWGVSQQSDWGVSQQRDGGVSQQSDSGVSKQRDWGVSQQNDSGVSQQSGWGDSQQGNWGVSEKSDCSVAEESDSGVSTEWLRAEAHYLPGYKKCDFRVDFTEKRSHPEQSQFRIPKSNKLNETNPFEYTIPQFTKFFKQIYTKGDVQNDGKITPLIDK